MLPLWNKKENLISKLKNTSGEHAATSFIKYPPPPPKKKKSQTLDQLYMARNRWSSAKSIRANTNLK